MLCGDDTDQNGVEEADLSTLPEQRQDLIAYDQLRLFFTIVNITCAYF